MQHHCKYFGSRKKIFSQKNDNFLGLLLVPPLTVVTKIWLEEVVIKDIMNKWDHAPL